MTSNKTFPVGEQFCMRAQFCRFTGKMFCAQRSIREHFCDEMGPYSVYLLLRSACDVRLVYLSDHFTRSDRLVVTQDLGYNILLPTLVLEPASLPHYLYFLSFSVIPGVMNQSLTSVVWRVCAGCVQPDHRHLINGFRITKELEYWQSTYQMQWTC